jgi:hypothetical protein
MVCILYTDGERPSEAAAGGVEGSLTSLQVDPELRRFFVGDGGGVGEGIRTKC